MRVITTIRADEMPTDRDDGDTQLDTLNFVNKHSLT